MSTTTITGETAVTAGNLTGAAVMEVEDVNGDTRKSSLATLRTKMLAGNTGYTATDPLVAGLGTFSDFLAIITAGKGLQVKQGTNCKLGSSVLSGGAATVANTSVTANSFIFLCRFGSATNAGALNVATQTASTGFTVTSSNASDAGNFVYLIVEAL